MQKNCTYLKHEKDYVEVLRNEKDTMIRSNELVVGDIIRLKTDSTNITIVPADCIVIE
jgi:magnesium-transporting ATPase (P-type)